MFTDWRESAEGREVFHILMKSYDVDAAKRILRKKPRQDQEIEARLLNHPLITGDPERAGDMTVPVIIATLPSDSHLPIDGWSRIKKACAEGTTVRYVILTKAETKKITL